MNTEPLDWQAPINQKLVRYEALVQLFEEIQRVDDVATIAQRVATLWKYFANVASCRLVVPNDPAFMIIDGARGEASVSHAATLDDWDARYWASQKPTLLTVAAASCSQPMPPEHLRLPGLVEIEVRPFVQGEACIALLSVASRHEAFNELDNKFIHLFGNQLAGRLHDMLMRQRSIRLLEASEARYRSVAENSADWIWVMDLKDRLIYSNERCRDMTGLNQSEICHTTVSSLLHPDDRDIVLDIMRRAPEFTTGLEQHAAPLPAH